MEEGRFECVYLFVLLPDGAACAHLEAGYQVARRPAGGGFLRTSGHEAGMPLRRPELRAEAQGGLSRRVGTSPLPGPFL